jgi:poly(beta-D-mannuronate) lyase
MILMLSTITFFLPPPDAGARPKDAWKLQLPITVDGKLVELPQSQLAEGYGSYYFRSPDGAAVMFRAPAGGATTSGSSYPRSELREMDGSRQAAWSTRSGNHVLTVKQAVTALPPVKPHIVTAQIHGGNDDVVQIRLEGKRLIATFLGDEAAVLDPDYKLGTPYIVALGATKGRVSVWHNGVKRLDKPYSGSRCYFKTGAYLQTNPSKGDDRQAIGEVALYGLLLSHT